MRFKLIGSILLSVALIGVLAACTFFWFMPPKQFISVKGTLTLAGDSADLAGMSEGDFCRGKKTYADLNEAAQAVFTDREGGVKLSSANLSPGKLDPYGNCVFQFSISKIEKTHNNLRTYNVS